MKKIFNLVEDKKAIINIFKNRKSEDNITITIGKENLNSNTELFSVITAVYKIGSIKGTLGVIGPKRMRYSKIIPIVKHTAELFNKIIN